MITQSHKKIAIIGCAGSGKTTIAFALQQKFNLPLYHLDDYYWLSNWQRVGIEKFTEIHTELCAQDAWIMEGVYLKLLPERLKQTDVLIFLDMPRYKCFWNVFKRSILGYGTVIPGSPSGCKQHIFTRKFLEFLIWIWNFNKKYRKIILDNIEQAQGKKQIYILKSIKEIDQFVKMISDSNH